MGLYFGPLLFPCIYLGQQCAHKQSFQHALWFGPKDHVSSNTSSGRLDYNTWGKSTLLIVAAWTKQGCFSCWAKIPASSSIPNHCPTRHASFSLVSKEACQSTPRWSTTSQVFPALQAAQLEIKGVVLSLGLGF